MEQYLIYISIFAIAALIIAFAVVCVRYNNLKDNYKIQSNSIIPLENKIKELDDEKTKNIQLQSNIDDQTDFISSLNERLQKAEAERDELKNYINVLQETHTNVLSECEELYNQRDKLQSKLSRKGLGKKGTKKNVYYCDIASGEDSTVSEIVEAIDISYIDDMSKYYGCEFIAKTQTDEEINGFVFKANVPESHGVFLLVSKSFHYYWYVSKKDDDAKYVSEEFLNAGYYAFFSSLLDCRNYKQFNIIKRG